MCPSTYYRSDITYGNVMNGDFMKLWNCEELKKHRHQFRTGDFLDVCQVCPVTELWKSQAGRSQQ
jgi:hypothetical protein